MAGIRVWDPIVRLSHWLVAALFLSNYWLLEEGDPPHEWAGYALLVTVLTRILWGFIGSRNARLTSFLPTPSRVAAHLRDIRKRPPLYQGHNPLGGLMVIFLWLMLMLTAVSGWLQTTDRYWGEPWFEQLHELAANTVMAAVVLHVIAVLIMARLTQTALVMPMIVGYRRPRKNTAAELTLKSGK